MSKPKRDPVTVEALIEALSEFPADMPVLVDGYEYGFDIPAGVYAVNVGYRGDDWWAGEFSDDREPSFAAVVIPR